MRRRTVLKALGLTAAAQLPAFARSFDKAPSPDLFFNQIGYRPTDLKAATVRGAAPGQDRFRLRRAADNQVVYEAPLTPPQTDAASGDLVQQAVFTAFQTPGTYRLEVGGQGSGPFPLNLTAYTDALRLTMRAFTGQRCGCAVDLGNGYHHAPCHLNGSYGASSGRTGSLPNHGGWHDAGDYGRYIVNSGISCGTLLWAWELYPDALTHLNLAIPKQHGNLPDFLEEVLWNLTWMRQLQAPDGGVFHKQTSDVFCAFILPEADTLPSHVIGTGAAPYKSTAATADFAAVMAIAARCYAPFDKALAAGLLTAARQAFAWAAANPTIVFHNPTGVLTGEYGDPHLADELLWAAAELWRTTGEPAYEQAFLAGLPQDREQITVEAPSWGSVASLACWTYLLAPHKGDAALCDLLRRKTRTAAQQRIDHSRINGYANTLALHDYGWGSNGDAGNQSLLLAVAHHLDPNPAASDAALANLHYLLGRNCFGVSWVTQLGTRPFLHPHHRPSAADNLPDPWPGLLSGGPNQRGGDRVADALPRTYAMRSWIDDQAAYSLNEIAINWNAPLVFLLAFANSRASRS